MVGGSDKKPQGRRGSKKGRRGGSGGAKDAAGGAGASDGGQSFPVVSDTRFSSMHSAPAFQRVKPDERKVELDDRFKAVLTDPRFQVSSAKVDKYGRQVSKASTKAKSQLRAFYKVEDDQKTTGHVEDAEDGEDGDEEEEEEEEDVEGDEEEDAEEEEEEGEEEEEEDEEEGGGGLAGPEESRQAYLTRLSRGEVSGSSSDTSSDEDEDDEDDDDDDELGSGTAADRLGLDDPSRGEAVPVSEETSRRLAVTNCDWDHIRARDLMVLCGSFCPGSARLLSVEVFPSDFGLEMMEVEAAAGPHAALAGSIPAVKSGGHAADESDDDSTSESGEGKGTAAEVGGGVSTAAGTAVDGKVVHRRRPGIIIEEYRTTEEEDRDGEDRDEGPGAVSSSSKNGTSAAAAPGEEEEDDDDEEEEEEGEGGGGERGQQGNDTNNSKGFDPETLRVYELRKLKYYFAVLECSSVAAAEAIYREVDGMEFEHSSVALDLRFIPDDVSFEGRQARDKSTSVPSSYQPPSFICKALQQTKVECTWDEAPSERQVLLGRVSQWRDAAEEDFEAYLASSSDEDGDSSSSSEEEEDAEEAAGGEGKEAEAARASSKRDKKEAARRARKLLLRDALDGSDDSDDSEGGGDDAGEEQSSDDEDGAEEEEGEDTEFSFVPRGTAAAMDEDGEDVQSGGAEGLLARRKAKEALANETPWEASLRKERERKRARKKAIKDRIEAEEAEEAGGAETDDDSDGGQEGDGFFLEEANSSRANRRESKNKKNKKGKKVVQGRASDGADGALAAAAMAGGADDEDEEDRRDYDMHRLAREEKLKGKKLRGKRKRKEIAREKAPGQDFRVDVADERFAAVLEGDTRFGIDRTDSSFKDTEGMRSILEERSRRKDKKKRVEPGDSLPAGTVTSGGGGDSMNTLAGGNKEGGNGSRKAGDLSSLVNKLKTRGLAEKGGEKSRRNGGDFVAGETRGGSSGARAVGGAQRVGSANGAGVPSAGGREEQAGGGGGGKGRRGKKKRRKA